jgi:hypothetical protein
MQNPTLLADLAWRLASSPEDVATAALTQILGRSDAARQALNTLMQQWSGAPNSAIARWQSQVVGSDDSRTDMEGYDPSNALRVILENKFWAGLTPNQPSTYLHKLPEHGLLVFVVPSVRVTSIEFELTDRVAGSALGTLSFRSVGASRVGAVSINRTLVVTSWDVLLEAIIAAAQADQDYSAVDDIRQLKGLTERADAQAFLPFTATDITGQTPRVLMKCYRVVDEAFKVVRRDKKAVSTTGLGRNVGPGWYGPNFRFHGYQCSLQFAADKWIKCGVSPIWLGIRPKDSKTRDHLAVLITAMLPDPKLKGEIQGNSLWLPLRLAEGRELDAVVDDVVRQIHHLGSVLAAHPAETSTEQPVCVPA